MIVGNNSLISVDNTDIVNGTFDIPKGVTVIGESVFYRCTNLTNIIIPSNVTEIGSFAFCFCESLEDITISSNITQIGYRAFYGCPNLTIHGVRGSYAEEYAINSDIEFKEIA